MEVMGVGMLNYTPDLFLTAVTISIGTELKALRVQTPLRDQGHVIHGLKRLKDVCFRGNIILGNLHVLNRIFGGLTRTLGLLLAYVKFGKRSSTLYCITAHR